LQLLEPFKIQWVTIKWSIWLWCGLIQRSKPLLAERAYKISAFNMLISATS